MSWNSRAAANLLPLSAEKDNLKTALKEWLYTGEMYDLEEAEEICELCDHPNIRYQFLIGNIHTKNELWIGSECITRFRISAIDATGEKLDEQQTKEKVKKDRRKLMSDAKEKSVINSLIALAGVDSDFEIDDFIKYYKTRKSFTPNQLSLLIWRLDKNDIEYKKTNFKMIIKKSREKEQLQNMEEWKIEKIWKCLSSSQKDFCIRLGLIEDE